MVYALCRWSKREERRKVTFILGENETEIYFVLIRKERWPFFGYVKAITGEL